jgi:hypothetical protein
LSEVEAKDGGGGSLRQRVDLLQGPCRSLKLKGRAAAQVELGVREIGGGRAMEN